MVDSNTHPTHEEKEIRCPKLGGPVNFDYCRVEQTGLPCSRAINCWSIHFDVDAFFRERLSSEEFEQYFLAVAPTKVTTLMELIENARKLAKEKRDENNEKP